MIVLKSRSDHQPSLGLRCIRANTVPSPDDFYDVPSENRKPDYHYGKK
jgi:hypothetical protein